MDFLYVKEKYLATSEYFLCLGDNIYAASIQEAIILGPIHFDVNNGKAKFSTKSVIIPACEFVTLVDVIHKAHKSFEDEKGASERPWDALIYPYTKFHHLIAKFEMFEGEATLRLSIKWNFAEDPNWNQLVAEGSKKPIDTSELVDKKWLHLKRGFNLKQRHVEALQSQMPSILGSSFQQNQNSRGQLMEFVNRVMANENLRGVLTNKMEDFNTLNFQDRMKLLNQLLDKSTRMKKGY